MIAARPLRPDCAGWPICKLADKSKGEAKRILKTWIKNEVLVEGEYISPRRQKTTACVRLDEGNAAKMLGSLYPPPRVAM